MKAVAGMKMSYQVQQAVLGPSASIIRGFRQDESSSALCSHLYSMIRTNRQHRRAFLISLLNLFDDSSVSAARPPARFTRFLSLALFCDVKISVSVSLSLSEQKMEVNMLLFVGDNLAYFPYQTQEEPLFIMHHIDITLSVSGSNLLQSFKEVRAHTLNDSFIISK